MSKVVSIFLATITALLVALCFTVVGAGSGSVASLNKAADITVTTTTPDAPDGNPWHG
jgi:hypothetical protein